MELLVGAVLGNSFNVIKANASKDNKNRCF